MKVAETPRLSSNSCTNDILNPVHNNNPQIVQRCLSAYLHSLLNYQTPTRSLRSANTNLLSVPRLHTTFASRGFSVAALAVWNSLPSDIHNSSSAHTFRRLLKTHCFQQAFGSPQRLTQVHQIRPLADTVHSKHLFTYLLISTQTCTDVYICACTKMATKLNTE